MGLSEGQKQWMKEQLAATLAGQQEVRRVVVFGSFLTSTQPHDLDVAVFQDSGEGYLALAMKYRRLTRDIARCIPLDIVPLRSDATGTFLDEVNRGEVVYER